MRAIVLLVACATPLSLEAQPWKTNGFVMHRFEIVGTGGRNNPVRRPIQPAYHADECFVRMRLTYDADSIDVPPNGDGEFFVLWLDQEEGNDGSPHANNIPNVGIHVQDGKNRFMVRFHSGGQRFGPPLVGDREFLIVGRLWKSVPGEDNVYDKLDLWVDPKPDEELAPVASVSAITKLTHLRWIGVSTGMKTEFDDRILVHDIALEPTWQEILRLPTSLPKTEVPAPSPIQKTVSFREHVYPILESRCFECHSGENAESDIRLDTLDEVLNQISPNDSKGSRIYQLVRDGEMPPDGRELELAEVETLGKWIDEGLDWDDQLLPSPTPTTDHWAFHPVVRPAVPSVDNHHWVRTPVDAFIARQHERAGVQPNPEADPSTIRRRLSLVLHGLPTELAKLDAEHSVEPDIGGMLSDVSYGERWGRHWLDIARWAESNGHQHNRDRPHAWRYRDWVIESFRQGKRYDAFVSQQVAGDLLEPASPESLIATGFLAAARYSGNELDKEIQRNDILVDVAGTTASAFLGLTMGCAQCHSHKFDPISMRDYYQFQAYFASGQPANAALVQTDEIRELVLSRWSAFDAVHHRLVTVKRRQGHPDPIYVTPKSVIAGMRPAEKKSFQSMERSIAGLDQTWCFLNPDSTRYTPTPHEMRWPLPRRGTQATYMLLRGEVSAKGPVVQPNIPLVFEVDRTEGHATRRELASWMTAPSNPLTARVWANRIWQWYFGEGLVQSSSDFGTQGTPPTHPELLDFLAAELIDAGWDSSRIHHLIADSATFRQSSQARPEEFGDGLYIRWTPRRLEAEAIRDSILAVSGQLDRRVGGPSVGHDSNRRSVYLKQRRESFPAQQGLFDGADGNQSCARRRTSTTPLQPLWLLNSSFVQAAATQMAARAGTTERAIELAYQRPATREELVVLERLEETHGLSSVCLVLFNSSEFLYIP